MLADSSADCFSLCHSVYDCTYVNTLVGCRNILAKYSARFTIIVTILSHINTKSKVLNIYSFYVLRQYLCKSVRKNARLKC